MVVSSKTWNAGYTFVAVLASALVSVLAVLAGIFLLYSERVFADFDAELPAGFLFFSKLGLPGIAAVWLGFMAVVGGMFLCERQKVAVRVVLAAGVLSGLYFLMMLATTLGMWMRVLTFVVN